MIRTAIIAALLFIASPAYADQFAAVIAFANVTAAKADPDVRQNYDAAQDLFADDRVLSVRAWRDSQDIAGVDGDGNPTVTHNYLPGVFFVISLPRLVPSLRDNASIRAVLNLDKCAARTAGCVVKANVSNAMLQDIRFSPIFAGMDIPWGALQ